MSWRHTVLVDPDGLVRVTLYFAGQVYATLGLRIPADRVEFLRETLEPLFQRDVHDWLDAWREEARRKP